MTNERPSVPQALAPLSETYRRADARAFWMAQDGGGGNYVWSAAAPTDRAGLVAVIHPRVIATDAGYDSFRELAAAFSKSTGRRVYIVQERSRWWLMLLAVRRDEVACPLERGEKPDEWCYDAFPAGRYADDRVIMHIEPGGTEGDWQLDGLS